MNAEQRAELFAYQRAIRAFEGKIVENAVEVNEHIKIIREWVPGMYTAASDGKPADVRKRNGIPYKCIQPHDSTANPGWSPDVTPALWMQYHGTSKATARPWVQPLGSEDRYRAGEWMIWTDGLAYPCLADTTFSPAEYPAAWGAGE